MILMVLTGILLVGVAAWIAQYSDLLRRLTLDIKGDRGTAIAEPFGPGEFRLRLALGPSIYARIYKGALPGSDQENNTEFSVPVVFDPADPGRFIPANRSYVPAVVSGLLFLIGMTFVLTARRAASAAERIQRLSRLKAEEDRRHKKHKGKHRHHAHHRHHGAATGR